MGLLVGTGLTKRFGGVVALQNVDFSLEEGRITGLIGPNGAGKTTLFNLVAGALKPSTGTVTFEGRDITGFPAYRICRAGIARTFQVPRPFPELTCLENVAVPLINRPGRGSEPWGDEAEGILETVGLADRRSERAGHLNLIDKKRLELARALAVRPRVLLLDEVLGGLNTSEIGQAVDLILRLRDEMGLTVFWIEHIMGAIMRAADWILVLDQGQKLAEGRPEEIAQHPDVIKAYLGHG